MGRNIRRLKRYEGGGEYPSLSQHRESRRRFLIGGAAVLGAGAVAACGRPFWSDHQAEMDGAMPEPNYHSVRLPASDDRAVYLIDGGYVRFYAVALTEIEDCAFFAIDARPALTDLLADAVGEHSYDELSTSQGVLALESQLRDLLDQAYNEDTGDIGAGWFVQVAVTLTRLDAPEILDGFAGSEPSYP